jgi:hypothetical protein
LVHDRAGEALREGPDGAARGRGEKLGLSPGDTVKFVIEGDRVIVAKHVEAEDDPSHAFTEWASPEDEKAYGGL